MNIRSTFFSEQGKLRRPSEGHRQLQENGFSTEVLQTERVSTEERQNQIGAGEADEREKIEGGSKNFLDICLKTFALP